MNFYKFASKALSLLLILSVVFSAVYFAPAIRAATYFDYRGSNTALKESYVTSRCVDPPHWASAGHLKAAFTPRHGESHPCFDA